MSDASEKKGKKDVDALLTEMASAAGVASGPKKPRKEGAAPPAPPAQAAAAAPKAAAAGAAEAKPPRKIKIRQVRSGICAPVDQKQALVGLGLRRIRHEVERNDTPSTRGLILKVRHLVEVVGE